MMVMENKQLYQQFRRTVEKSAWFMIFLIFIIESIVAVITIQEGLIEGNDSPLSYTLSYVVLPTLINMECAAIFHYVEYKTKFSERVKNIFLIVVFDTLCLTTALVNNALHMISLSFLLPVFLSALFGNKKMTRFTFVMAFISYLITMVNGIYYTTLKEPMVYLDYIAGIVLLCAGYMVARSIIIYEQKNNRTLKEYNQRQEEMIEEMKKDSLTKLYNHNTFYETLNEQIKKGRAEQKTVSLSILDIDNFKRVNDTYGHVMGDKVLIRLSQLMKKYETESMIMARYGGEEFCILFYDLLVSEAYATLEAMRLEFSHIIFHDIDDARVTFSAGLVELVELSDNATALVEKADTAMYVAKREGKNKVIIYEEEKKYRENNIKIG